MTRPQTALVATITLALLWATSVAALTPTPTPTRASSGGSCAGDCDASGGVDVSEVIRCVGMAAGGTSNICLRCDVNGDGDVAINEIVAAVNALLSGCTPGDAFEPDNSADAAKPIACGEVQVHDLRQTGDSDWVRIDLPPNMSGVVETEAADEGYWDTTLTLYSSSGALLAYNDDYASGFSRLDFGCPAQGAATRYYARAAALSGGPLGRYGLRLICGQSCPTPSATPSPTATVAPDRFEPDDIQSAASAIACGQVQRHTAPYNDVDWVDLTLATRSAVHVRVQPIRGSVQFSIYDRNGADIAYPYYDTFECGRNALDPDTYHIRLSNPYSYEPGEYDVAIFCEPCGLENATPTQTYTNTPTETPIPPDEHEMDDRDSAVPINCGEAVTRSLAPRGDSDWLMLQVPERSAVRIQTFGTIATPQLALQDMTGRDIGIGYGLIDRVCGESALDAGTYFIETFGADYYTFPYDVWVSCSPCAETGPPTPSIPTRTPTVTPLMRDDYEPDNSPSQAGRIECGDLQIHSLDSPFDEDWVAFELPVPSAVTLVVPAVSIELYDENQQYVSSGYGVLDFNCAQSPRPAGRYLAHVPRSYASIASYNLSLLCAPCPATPTPTPTRPPTATRPPTQTRTPGGPSDGVRLFQVEPSTLLADPTGTGSGLFTTGLSGANASNGPGDGFSAGPLVLALGIPDVNGVAPLRLQEDVVLRIGIIDGSYLCLKLHAADSDGAIDCDGGTAFDTRGVQPSGDVGFPFVIETGLGTPAGPGNGHLLIPALYQSVAPSSPDFGRPCSQVTYDSPPQVFAFTTTTAVADKGGLVLSVPGEPFGCDDFVLPCSGGALAAPIPGSMVPIGDVANVIRLAESGASCAR